MSLNNDFAVASMVQQRRDDLLAEAAADRLARQAAGGRGWWQRVSDRFSQTRKPINRIRRDRLDSALAKQAVSTVSG